MAKQTHLNVGGNWKAIKSIWYKANGTWRKDVMNYFNASGVYKECMSYETVFLSSPQTIWDKDIFAEWAYSSDACVVAENRGSVFVAGKTDSNKFFVEVDINTGTEIAVSTDTLFEGIIKMFISPDEQYIYALYYNRLRCINIDTLNEEWATTCSASRDMAITKAGDYIYVGADGPEDNARKIDTSNGNVVWIHYNYDPIRSIDVTDDGEYIVYGEEDNGTLTGINKDNGDKWVKTNGTSYDIRGLTIDKNYEYVYPCFSNGDMLRFDIASQTFSSSRIVSPHITGSFNNIYMNKDNKYILAYSYDYLRLINVQNDTVEWSLFITDYRETDMDVGVNEKYVYLTAEVANSPGRCVKVQVAE